MNAVIIAVVVMLGLAVARVHVVLALLIGAIVGGLVGGLGIGGAFAAFQDGIGNGASIALNYALLGAFALAVANAGLPRLLAESIINRIDADNAENNEQTKEKAVAVAKWLTVAGLLLMAVMSQNLVPVHIAFIPLIVPPLLSVLNKMQVDRRLITCVLTFGLVTTYFFIPVGFGNIYMNDILRSNIVDAGMPEANNISVMQAMSIPALGMLTGVLFAVFVSYRKNVLIKKSQSRRTQPKPSRFRVIASLFPSSH